MHQLNHSPRKTFRQTEFWTAQPMLIDRLPLLETDRRRYSARQQARTSLQSSRSTTVYNGASHRTRKLFNLRCWWVSYPFARPPQCAGTSHIILFTRAHIRTKNWYPDKNYVFTFTRIRTTHRCDTLVTNTQILDRDPYSRPAYSQYSDSTPEMLLHRSQWAQIWSTLRSSRKYADADVTLQGVNTLLWNRLNNQTNTPNNHRTHKKTTSLKTK